MGRVSEGTLGWFETFVQYLNDPERETSNVGAMSYADSDASVSTSRTET